MIRPGGELRRFLAEDVGTGDITGALVPDVMVTAVITAKEPAIVAGALHAKSIFALRRCTARILIPDGRRARQNQRIIEVRGGARGILACERTALNLLSRMSGIATQTRLLASALPRGVKLYATRKTAPGLRYFDKEAVEIGGGMPHRMRLDESVLIKDNHLAVAGSMGELISRAKKKRQKIEIEVENADDAVLAARMGADIIMLDNFAPSQVSRTVQRLKQAGLRGRVRLEASGGISAKNIGRYARTGIDMISSGSLTGSVYGIDYTLDIRRS